ncbi:MAG: hypothetical protein QG657_4392 [Acidobacteriota bacterium]|nr:hypothetical protein [Acidobacteriota bacterium]
MSPDNLKSLLDISEEFGLQREVDSVVVLSGFLRQLWEKEHQPQESLKETLSDFLRDEYSTADIENHIVFKMDDNKKNIINSIQEFLRQVLLINPTIESSGSDDPQKKPKQPSYFPIYHRFLAKMSSQRRLGQTLGILLDSALKDKKSDSLEKIRRGVTQLGNRREAEENFVDILFMDPVKKKETGSKSQGSDDRVTTPPNKNRDYASLFIQMGEDLANLFNLDTNVLSKSRMFLYLERFVNLYALLYYLQIIGSRIDEKGKLIPPGQQPLILPICSNEMGNSYYRYSEECCQIYRMQAESFWRKYILDRVSDNVRELKCSKLDAEKILNHFLEPDRIWPIFRVSDKKIKTTGKKVIEDLEKVMKEKIDLLKNSSMSPVEIFTEAFLQYNLMGQRTLARIRWIFNRQGRGAGLVSLGLNKIAHFQLKPELLELLVIIFSSRCKGNPAQLSLRNFIHDIRRYYGIVLGPSEGLENALEKQGLPVPPRYLLEDNLDNLTRMLRNLNMLKSRSDTAKYITSPFPWLKENNE